MRAAREYSRPERTISIADESCEERSTSLSLDLSLLMVSRTPTNMPPTIFVSGPQWLPRGYYTAYYCERVNEAFKRGARFVVGGSNKGIDAYAQEHLATLENVDVTVHCTGSRDGRHSKLFTLVNGYATFADCDRAMTRAATEAICVLPQYGGGQSSALVPTLTRCGRISDVSAPHVLKTIRRYSEPYSAEMMRDVRAVYEKHYGVE